jgi:GntR family transcriptional regulator
MRKRITSGLWASGQQLVGEADLAVDLGMARGTVRRAIKELCDAGLLVQRHGRGTFVAKRTANPFANRMESLGERMVRAGIDFETRELSREVVEDGSEFGIEGETTMVLRRVRSINGQPVAVLTNAIPVSLFPRIGQKNLTRRPLYTVLEEDYGAVFEHAERTFRALSADDELAELLEVPVGTPLLAFVQVSWGPQEVVLDVAETWIRSDRHQPTVTMWRNV